MIIKNNGYDCRLFLEGMILELGEYYEVPVKFLNKELAMLSIRIDENIILWEGKPVADGKITRIIP